MTGDEVRCLEAALGQRQEVAGSVTTLTRQEADVRRNGAASQVAIGNPREANRSATCR